MLPRADFPTFAGGELSPQVAARYDTAKYQTALRACRNMLILPEGGVYRRPGFEFVGNARDHSKRLWLQSFQVSADESRVIEWSDLGLRIIAGGGYVLAPEIEITAITNANPMVATIPANGYSLGEEVYFENVEGMTEINGRLLRVIALDGDSVTFNADSREWGAFVGSGGGVPGDAGGGVGGEPPPPTDGDPIPPVPDIPDRPDTVFPLPPLYAQL